MFAFISLRHFLVHSTPILHNINQFTNQGRYSFHKQNTKQHKLHQFALGLCVYYLDVLSYQIVLILVIHLSLMSCFTFNTIFISSLGTGNPVPAQGTADTTLEYN